MLLIAIGFRIKSPERDSRLLEEGCKTTTKITGVRLDCESSQYIKRKGGEYVEILLQGRMGRVGETLIPLPQTNQRYLQVDLGEPA